MAEAQITQMGAEGEGMALLAGKPVYVPFTLPGELAAIAPGGGNRARLQRVLRASPERREPRCRHFGACGGCVLQHWQAEPYQAWKQSRLTQALAQAGVIEADIKGRMTPLFSVRAGARRRLVLSAAWRGGALQLGFNRLHSHDIIAVEQCPVAEPALVAALPFLRRLLALLRPRREGCHIVLAAAENGLDIALQGLTPPLKEEEKRRCADYMVQAAAAAHIVRLSSAAEILVEFARPFVHFGAVPAELPPGAFLQAAAAAEDYMGAVAAHALRRCKNIADLFAGCGSFTFRLAGQSNVHAVEQDKAALAALAQAAAGAAAVQAARHGAAAAVRPAIGGAEAGEARVHKAKPHGAAAGVDKALNGGRGAALKKITYEQRDLFRRPLTVRELAAYDGLVFDPPRAGAQAQAGEIAKSAVKTVIAVSCNPPTLARDIGILLSGGYQLQSITPIDQFLWSPHSEAIAILTKRPAKKSWVL